MKNKKGDDFTGKKFGKKEPNITKNKKKFAALCNKYFTLTAIYEYTFRYAFASNGELDDSNIENELDHADSHGLSELEGTDQILKCNLCNAEINYMAVHDAPTNTACLKHLKEKHPERLTLKEMNDAYKEHKKDWIWEEDEDDE